MQEGFVTSGDGTRIAYERLGHGPALVLVGGGLTDRTENQPLVPALAEGLTVYNYDRRGRGRSNETPPYSVAREIEDLDALIADAGGRAHVYGVSSGGALALEAAATGSSIDHLAVYEVPYSTADDWPARWQSYRDDLGTAAAHNDRGAAVEAFLRITGSSDADIIGMRGAPFWADLKAIAHTLAHDAACLGTGQPPLSRLATISQPTLVLTGDDRPADAPAWVRALDDAADAVAAAVPNGRRQTLADQGHVTDPSVVAGCLIAFVGDGR